MTKSLMKSILIVLIIVSSTTLSTFANEEFYNAQDLEDEIYNHMQNWEESFSFSYNGDDIIDIVESASEKDDYLERSIKRFKISQIGEEDIVDITYTTTKEQEDYISSELKKVLEQIINPNMNESDIVKAINEYIVKRYTYDRSLEEDNAYYALTTGLAMCQGYSMTAYKMFEMSGLECRIVIGTLNGEGHAWNLVKVDENWYHIDVTNNDDIIRDSYLLVSDDSLSENGFDWDRTQYPISTSNYYNILTSYIDETNEEKNVSEVTSNNNVNIDESDIDKMISENVEEIQSIMYDVGLKITTSSSTKYIIKNE